MCKLARRLPPLGTAVAMAVAVAALGVLPAHARDAATLAGSWQLAFGGTGASCRVQLQAARSDSGDFFLGMPPACRHAMPDIAAAGRWATPDDAHLVLAAPGGKALLTLTAAGNGWIAAGPTGSYTLMPAGAAAPETSAPFAPPPASARIEQISTHGAKASSAKAGPAKVAAVDAADVTGRYAVMREKHDTGCMLTLDRSRGKSGDRAQLAPGCRDQGIVIFDPTGWQLVHGELVLTARAGHKTKLDPAGDGAWSKDPKDGGKPLGLKKL